MFLNTSSSTRCMVARSMFLNSLNSEKDSIKPWLYIFYKIYCLKLYYYSQFQIAAEGKGTFNQLFFLLFSYFHHFFFLNGKIIIFGGNQFPCALSAFKLKCHKATNMFR